MPMYEDSKQRVMLGVSILDEFYADHDWTLDIETNELDINSLSSCILGQLFEDYDYGLWLLGDAGYKDVYSDPASYGFLPTGGNETSLTSAWTEYINHGTA